METGGLTRSANVTAQAAPSRLEQAASKSAVKPELSQEKAVTQAKEMPAVRYEPSRDAQRQAAVEQSLQEAITRQVEVDPKTKDVVFRTVNVKTGDVVRQFPDEALMRLRAYAQEMTKYTEQKQESRERYSQVA